MFACRGEMQPILGVEGGLPTLSETHQRGCMANSRCGGGHSNLRLTKGDAQPTPGVEGGLPTQLETDQRGRRHATNSGCGLETDQRGCIVSFGHGGAPPNQNPAPIKGKPPSAPSYKHGLATWTNSMKSNPHVHSTCQPPNRPPA